MDPVDIFNDLMSGDTCTLATASPDGKPEAATIKFAWDGENLHFDTYAAYRKYNNLISNPKTSIVVTKGLQSVQMDGECEELHEEKAQESKEFHDGKRGKESRFATSESKYFIFKPSWIRVYMGPEGDDRFVVIKQP